MIVPSNRSLFWVGMALPFVAMGAMLPSTAVASLVLIAGIVAAVMIRNRKLDKNSKKSLTSKKSDDIFSDNKPATGRSSGSEF